MTQSPDVVPAKTTALGVEELELVTELTRKFGLLGGRVPTTCEEFWRAMGHALQIAIPAATAVEMAKEILARLGEGWDDDFADDDRPSLSAYEALVERLNEREQGEETSEDEDDDATGALASEAQIVVVGQDAPISTISEWITDGTLKLDPDWQRGYVWKGARKRRFIESIFLQLPIPPVLLFRDNTGKQYVIDGRQRLETVYRYRLGTADKARSFSTFSKKTPGWGEGEPLAEAAGKRFDKLPVEFQRKFNTFIIPARIFQNLERKKLYEVFKRYNTGGDKLNPAEIRNAVYQGEQLHETLYRLAGEGPTDRYKDNDERSVGQTLRKIMKNKTARYGAYNFIGRVLAFTHMPGGSVAAAVNKLMETYKDQSELLRREFIQSFEATLRWYAQPLCAEMPSGKTPFHEWIATIQMVSSTRGLQLIVERKTTEERLQRFIDDKWPTFVGGTPGQDGSYQNGLLQEKQNTTNHWEKQREWVALMEKECCVQGTP